MDAQLIIIETKAYLVRKGMSQEALAKKIDYSSTALSQVLSGQYAGNPDPILKKLAHEIGLSSTKWEILSTNNFQSIMNTCTEAQEDSFMMGVYGATGWGKTTTLAHYCSTTRNAYYVLGTMLMKPKDLILAIQKQIGDDEPGTLSERIDSIVEKLSRMQNPLLVIEDMGKLDQHPKCFGIVQLLFDRLKGRCGFVIAGTHRLPTFIRKMADKDVLGFREFARRVSYWQPLVEKLEMKFINAVSAKHEITNKGAIEYIASNCTNYGDVEELIRGYNKYKERHGEISMEMQASVLAELKFNQLPKKK